MRLKYTEVDSKRLFDYIDADSKGYIQYGEFYKVIASLKRPTVSNAAANGAKGYSEGGIYSTAAHKIDTEPLLSSIDIEEPSSVKKVSKLARGEAKPKRVYKGLSNFGKAKNSKDPQHYQSKPLNFSSDHAFGRPT